MNDTCLQVGLNRCSVYNRTSIAEIIDGIMDGLGLSGGFHGKIILLKPNLISAGGPPLACTHGEFIAGVALWFLGQGAKVVLGDSPAFGSASRVCEKHGITSALVGLDIRYVEFTSPVIKKLPCGVSVTVAREALECDLFVGLPKVKAHNQMYVTLAVKNIFGIVKGVNKAKLHMIHGNSHDQFVRIILDLVSLLPPQLHLMDGIHVMHRSGPLDGSQLDLHCIAAARCPVALDTAMLDLLELDEQKSPLWHIGFKEKLAGSNGRNIIYPYLSPHDFYGSGFVAPATLNPIRFSIIRFLRGIAKRLILTVHA